MALVEDELKNSRLVSPFEPVDANAGYYLIINTKSEPTERFKKWLLQQVRL
jgi:hypothetical protein